MGKTKKADIWDIVKLSEEVEFEIISCPRTFHSCDIQFPKIDIHINPEVLKNFIEKDIDKCKDEL